MFRETILAHIPTLKQIINATMFLNLNNFICETFFLVKYLKTECLKNIWKQVFQKIIKHLQKWSLFWRGSQKRYLKSTGLRRVTPFRGVWSNDFVTSDPKVAQVVKGQPSMLPHKHKDFPL